MIGQVLTTVQQPLLVYIEFLRFRFASNDRNALTYCPAYQSFAQVRQNLGRSLSQLSSFVLFRPHPAPLLAHIPELLKRKCCYR